MRRAPPAQQPAVVEEEGTLPHVVSLQACTPVDGSLPGVSVRAASLLAWHPTRQRLAAASTAALVEYDAVSGARRNLVELPGTPLRLAYTPNGSAVLLLTKERGIYAWGAGDWKRRVLLAPDPKHAGKKLGAALLAVSAGQHPVVYWTPLGKNSVRMVRTAPVEVPRGGKLDRELVPGVKLKTENKKPVVGLAVHPTESGTLYCLLADGTLQVCAVAGAAVSQLATLPVPGVDPAAERVSLHAWPHPVLPGGALLAVEAAASGVAILEAVPRQEPRLLGTLTFGAGSAICGCGLLAGGLLCAAGRHASGNVQVQAWELAGDSRELQVLPTVAAPGMVWDALQGVVAGKAALADVSGDNVITRLHFHPPSGAIAAATALRGREAEAGHQRVPLLALVDGAGVAGAPDRSPLHSGLGFWTARDSGGAVVSKLRFPRYAHVLSAGRVAAYDLTHGVLADCLALPPANAAGQERALVRAVRSPRLAAWLAVTRVLSRRKEGAPLGPGQREFSLVTDSDAALTAGQWMLPGADGAFAGPADELLVVLANSGRTLSVFESAKLLGAGAGGRPLFVAELREGPVAAVHPGPPAHIPAPPTPCPVPPRPEADLGESDDSDAGEDDAAAAARADWEAGERRRLEPPRLVLLQTQANQLVLADVSPSAATHSHKARLLPSRAVLALRPGEVVAQVAWQPLMPAEPGFHAGSEGAGAAVAAAAAVLTSQRLLLVSERLAVLASVGLPSDQGLPVSCLWMGPALLLSTATGQVLQVCWDGKLEHLCSLLQGPPPALLGALADRLLVATRAAPGGRAEVGARGISALQPLLLGWASLAARRILPGGAARARAELRALVASYDASQLGVGALERLAAAGFADVAAAVAVRSDSPAITPAHRAVFQAAAGDWSPLLALVLQEWEASPWHPGPPPRASALYGRMVALARTCARYGRFADARALLAGAGAAGEAAALCVFQGDFAGLGEAARVGGRGASRLADQLMAVNEHAFTHGSAGSALYGGAACTADWAVAAGGGGGGGEGGEGPEGGGGALELEVAPAGRLPFQEASLQVLTAGEPPRGGAGAGGEGVPVAPLDLAALEAYLGVAGAHVLKPAVSTPTAAAGGGAALARMETGLSEFGLPLEAESERGGGGRGGGSVESGSEGGAAVAAAPRPGRDETAAQTAARAAFRRDTADDEDDFFSSDEESAPTEGGDSASVTTASAAASSRFRVSIRPADEAPAPGARGGQLRAAALSLRLGVPSSTAGSADSTPLATARSVSGPAGGQPGGLPPPPGAASPAKPPAGVPDAAAVESDDPFAGLFGPGPAPGPAAKAAPPPPPPAAAGPMRAPPPGGAQPSLLSGWDDFEALFAAPGAAQRPPPSDPFGPVSFPPPPPPAAPAAAAGSPPKGKPRPGGGAAPPAPADSAPPAARQAVEEGLALLAAGRWAEASAAFGRGVDAAGGGGGDTAQRALQLFVAARLLAAAAPSPPPTAARLSRFALSLPALGEGPARVAAVRFAVDANVAARNYGWAADQLTWLVVRSTEGGGVGVSAGELQERLNACDRAGGGNASLPRDEDTDSFAAIVGCCGGRGEAEELVGNIVSAG